MSSTENPNPKVSAAHLPPALKDLIAKSKLAETPIDDAQLDRLFESIRRNNPTTPSSSSSSRSKNEESTKGLWLIILTGALFALNAVDVIPHLYRYAIAQTDGTEEEILFVAERMREVGLKTVSFMGVPRVMSTLIRYLNDQPDCFYGVSGDQLSRGSRCCNPRSNTSDQGLTTTRKPSVRRYSIPCTRS
jgi:hypothetical protein